MMISQISRINKYIRDDVSYCVRNSLRIQLMDQAWEKIRSPVAISVLEAYEHTRRYMLDAEN